MLVDDLFPPEVIDEDIRKWMSGALAAGTVLGAAAAPHENGNKFGLEPAAKEVAALAQTMWGEARNQGTLGMLAVGYVIKNRAESGVKRFGGDLVRDVALKSKQFSCWNQDDPNRKKMGEMIKIDNIIKNKVTPPGEKSFDDWFSKFKNTPDFADYQSWRSAFKLAKDILSNKAKDPTNGSVFYHTTSVHPVWAKHAKPEAKIANHIFYKLDQIKPKNKVA